MRGAEYNNVFFASCIKSAKVKQLQRIVSQMVEPPLWMDQLPLCVV